jgi:hypothetical protein
MLDDLRFALRLTRRTPVLSLTAMVSLTIGFALAAAGFTAVKTAFFGTLPGPYGNRIVAIYDFNRVRPQDRLAEVPRQEGRMLPGHWGIPAPGARRERHIVVFDRCPNR